MRSISKYSELDSLVNNYIVNGGENLKCKIMLEISRLQKTDGISKFKLKQTLDLIK